MSTTSSISAIRTLRWVGIAEGLSFLVLLCIAMPLKYMYDMPLPVKITGWAHGVLFIGYIYAVINAWSTLKWKFSKAFIFLAASLLPLATFILDKNLKKEELQYLEA